MNINTLIEFILFFYLGWLIYSEHVKTCNINDLISEYKLSDFNKNTVKDICGKSTTRSFFRKTLRKVLSNKKARN